MLNDLIMASGKVEAPIGYSGVFVRPTSHTASANNGAGTYTNIDKIYDADLATYGETKVQYNGVKVTLRFLFDTVIPAGSRVTIRLAKGSNVSQETLSCVNAALGNPLTLNIFYNPVGTTDFTYVLPQDTKAIDLVSLVASGYTNASYVDIFDLHVEL